MKFFIHIGTHKTGSTALQFFLLKNKKKLQELGYLYPTAGLADAGHHEIAWAAQKNNQPLLQNLIDSVKKEAQVAGCENIILSSEEFEFIRDFTAIKQVLKDSCQFIVYLRRQDTYLESEYNQHVKMYSTRYKEDIFKFYFDYNFMMRFDYRFLCDLWTQHFGENSLSVIGYDPLSKRKHGIFRQFLIKIGLAPVLYNDFMPPADNRINMSLPNQALLYLTYLNVLPFSIEQHQLSLQILKKKFSAEENRPLLALSDRKKLINRFKESNEWVENKYNTKFFLSLNEADFLNESLGFNDNFNIKTYNEILREILVTSLVQ